MGPAAFGYLIVKSPVKYRGRVFRIEPGQVIGRREGDILINDRLVSRQHARINLDTRSKPPVFSILDFGTPNGTYVNHRRIDGPQPIEENDEIRLGDHIFVFKMLLHPREEQSQAG
ncbi:MAG: FHA domain-containing protein [Chloroflexota bacterium]